MISATHSTRLNASGKCPIRVKFGRLIVHEANVVISAEPHPQGTQFTIEVVTELDHVPESGEIVSLNDKLGLSGDDSLPNIRAFLDALTAKASWPSMITTGDEEYEDSLPEDGDEDEDEDDD